MIPTLWAIRASPEEKPLEASLEGAGSPLFLKLLAHRGLKSPEEIQNFLYPHRENLPNPFLMKGMQEAVRRLQKARQNRDKILIHGDYDVDGVTGTALLSLALEKLGIPCEPYLPERGREGYGVSRAAIQKAQHEGIRLLVTVDCGISAREEIREARDVGIETIVLDHHELPQAGLPPAEVILNPLQEGCAYPFKELSAGGLALKLAQALLGREAFDYFDLAALSTVADLAPLVGENRIFVKEGLRQLSERKRIGLKALAHAANLRARDIKVGHVGFILGPRINASGRMSTALTALRLLLTSHEREAASLAQILEEENRERQREDRRVLSEAIEAVERGVNFSRERILVVAHEGWHPGVIGIVASRLVERYHRPAVVIALQDRKGKGSARSIRGFHLFKALESAQEFLLEFGGHEQAAGFRLEEKAIPLLRKRLNEHAYEVYSPEVFLRSLEIDLEITFSDLTPRFLRELELLEPCGVGNPKPLFLTRGLWVKQGAEGRKGGFARSRQWVTDGRLTYEVVSGDREALPFDFEPGTRLDLVYTVNQRNWEGEEIVVLEMKDAKGLS